MYFKCFTDGSFGNKGETHGGLVFYKDGVPMSALHVYTMLPEFADMRNVGGEIIAAWSAINSVVQLLKSRNVEECGLEAHILYLVYDYEGVGKWLTGQWKTNKIATKWFVQNVKELLSSVPTLTVNYIWVKGHSVTEGNNRADKVANYNMEYCKINDISCVCVDSLIKL